MRIFISHASEDEAAAEQIHHALRNDGHEVFLSSASLAAGRQFHRSIRAAIRSASVFVFLISPSSLQPRRYTLSELNQARRRWPRADGHVLPVVVEAVPMNDIPSYLRSVTLLEPQGDLAADVAQAVAEIKRETPEGDIEETPRWWLVVGASALGLTMLALLSLIVLAVLHRALPCDARWLVGALLALVTAMSSRLLGGTATVRGSLPLLGRHSLLLSGAGAVAVFALVWVLFQLLVPGCSSAEPRIAVTSLRAHRTPAGSGELELTFEADIAKDRTLSVSIETTQGEPLAEPSSVDAPDYGRAIVSLNDVAPAEVCVRLVVARLDGTVEARSKRTCRPWEGP
jgi:hypothetical protein